MDPDQQQQHYFQVVSARSKVKKSVAARQIPKEDNATLKNHLGEESERLLDEHRQKFCEFYFLLKEGFNLILSGFGSKRTLLNEFSESWLNDETSLTIPGFFPEITSRMIISSLKTLLDCDGSDAQSLRTAAGKMNKDAFLVIHSVDRLLSSNPLALNQLLTNLIVASKGYLHLVATVDHVNAGMLWDSKDKNRLNLFYYNCPTFQSFQVEREYMSTFSSGGNVLNDLNLSSVQHVYDSLNPNAKNIFRLILEHYLKQPEKVENLEEDVDSENEARPKRRRKRNNQVDDPELTFSALYKMCREKYLVNSEVTLRTQLIEFQDHKILKVTNQTDGVRVVSVLICRPLVVKFLETIESN